MRPTGFVPDQVFPHPDDGATRSSDVDPDLGRLASLWFLSLSRPGNRKGEARPPDGRHPPVGTLLGFRYGATRTAFQGSIRWMADVHPLPLRREIGATRSIKEEGKAGRSTVGTPLRETGATRMYRSGGSDGRKRSRGKPPWKAGGKPPSDHEDGTLKHHTPDGSRSSGGKGQPDPLDVTTQIQGPTKEGIGATRCPRSIGPLEQEEISVGTGQPEPPGYPSGDVRSLV